MKTIKEHLESIPDPLIRASALNCSGMVHEVNATSLCQAIYTAFEWYDTIEGHDFWEQCANAAEGLREWPTYPLPVTPEPCKRCKELEEEIDAMNASSDHEALEQANATAASLLAKLEKVTAERDILKEQLEIVTAERDAEREGFRRHMDVSEEINIHDRLGRDQ